MADKTGGPAVFRSLYGARDYEREVFGDRWCGPDELPHAASTLCAVYPKPAEDSDGQRVEVDVAAWPSRFYRIRALADKNSVGRPVEGVVLSTGSGMHQLAADLAQAFSEGMIGVHTEDAA